MASSRQITPRTITPSQFRVLHALYPSTARKVQQAKRAKAKNASGAKDPVDAFVEEDKWRYEELPTVLGGRKKEKGSGAYLEKKELERLMAWKLKHGKYRPTLPGLIAQNPPQTVTDSTKAAFASLLTTSAAFPETSLKVLIKDLKGVGPATASLILAAVDPTMAPFFSDELFLWMCCNGDAKAKIKYDLKEYRMLWEKIGVLRARFNGTWKGFLKAKDIEQVGFVIGHLDMLEEGDLKRLDDANVEKATDSAAGTAAGVGENVETDQGRVGRKKRKDPSNLEVPEVSKARPTKRTKK